MAIKKCKDTFFQLRFDIFAYVMYLEHIFSIEIEYGNMHSYFDIFYLQEILDSKV